MLPFQIIYYYMHSSLAEPILIFFFFAVWLTNGRRFELACKIGFVAKFYCDLVFFIFKTKKNSFGSIEIIIG